jgi:hypothetical protein
MKSFLNCLIVCGLVILVGCSGSSPSPPKDPVTPGLTWQITALAASDDNPFVNTVVLVSATVTADGEAAPDGTNVEFLANGGIFTANGGTLVNVTTSGGTASAQFGAIEPGVYLIQARVNGVTRQVQIAYRNPDQSDSLQIYNLNPASGSYFGSETVVITGKGISAPAEVYFTVQGVQYQAVVDQVVPSVPPSSAGTITIRSPEPTAADTTLTSPADVKVIVDVGATTQQEVTVPAGFTYIGNSTPPPNVAPTPVIFGVDPYYGRSAGGETVTILGMDFTWDDGVNKQIVATFDEVYFTFQGQEFVAQVERFSETQIEVITPRFSLTPLQANTNAGVKLTRIGDVPVEKTDVFIVQADIVTPEITGISPTAGPFDGGTIVTISGHGFELPLQVLFGTLEATEIQLFDDTSLADNDIITCRTPDYSQTGQLPPLAVNVQVTNLQTGRTTTSAQTFTFGETLYVTQADPTEGQIGDLLTLYGSGFEDPLTVWFRAGGEVEFDVISVTGTELTLKSPSDLAPTCNDRSGSFRVVLNQSGREAEGGQYTLLGSNPTITGVDPIFVQETDFGNGVDPAEIDINGVRFNDDLLVTIGGFTMPPGQVTVESPERIHVSGIPAPNDFDLTFDTDPCTTGSGLPGIRKAPTAVDVTVQNLPLGCQDTLSQALIYVPEDQDCVAAPNLQVTLNPGPNFPATPAGSCSLPQQLVLTNNGEGTLEVQTALLVGRFFFDAGQSNQNAGPITVPAFTSNTSLEVYFCPDEPNGLTYSGTLVVTSNDPNSPAQIGLSGDESTPPAIATSPYSSGETWTFPATTAGTCSATEFLTISNPGISDLTLASVVSSDGTQFNITTPVAPNTVLAPTQSLNVGVEFCPTAAGAVTATLTIDHNATNEPDPIVIDFSGQGL